MTFVEVLTGLFIFSIIFIGFMRAAAFSKFQIIYTNEIAAATKVVSETMELIRAKDFSTIQAWGTRTNANYEALSGDNLISLANLNAGGCLITTQHFTDGGQTYNDALNITVKVTWQSIKGSNEQLQAATIVSSGGING